MISNYDNFYNCTTNRKKYLSKWHFLIVSENYLDIFFFLIRLLKITFFFRMNINNECLQQLASRFKIILKISLAGKYVSSTSIRLNRPTIGGWMPVNQHSKVTTKLFLRLIFFMRPLNVYLISYLKYLLWHFAGTNKSYDFWALDEKIIFNNFRFRSLDIWHMKHWMLEQI